MLAALHHSWLCLLVRVSGVSFEVKVCRVTCRTCIVPVVHFAVWSKFTEQMADSKQWERRVENNETFLVHESKFLTFNVTFT